MTEKDLHKSICFYLQAQYPKVIFNTDMSGLKLTMGQSVQAKKLRSSNGFPDITILEPSTGYNALFIEVKKETPYKKDGTLKSNRHLEEQQEMHKQLMIKGYYAAFVWSFEQAKEILDEYLNNR